MHHVVSCCVQLEKKWKKGWLVLQKCRVCFQHTLENHSHEIEFQIKVDLFL